MPIISTRGVASAKALGLASGSAGAYIEDVFSAYTYTGNTPSSQTITNGIDLSTKGGLVWIKRRSAGAIAHLLYDTARGVKNLLYSNQTVGAAIAATYGVTSFNSNGFTILDTPAGDYGLNTSGQTTISWTFRKQPKFFDVVTYTGNGTANRTVAHSLGSAVGCVIIKQTSNVSDWEVWHRADGTTPVALALNDTRATYASFPANFVSANMTATTIGLASHFSGGNTNASGVTYVAYLFAHDAGGFGLTGTDNVISCGSYSGTSAAGNFVNLGFEPQFLMVKEATVVSTGGWFMVDAFRGVPTGGNDSYLSANASDAEASPLDLFTFRATGFATEYSGGSTNTSGRTYIYIAIRRGPMKVPTTGTSVFGLSARTGTGVAATVTGGQTADVVLIKNRGAAVNALIASRLTGTGSLVTSDVSLEVASDVNVLQANPWDVMNGVKVGTTSTQTNASTNTFINYLFKRAPSFMDVVCYTGTGVARTVAHNLTVSPELILLKERAGDGGGPWLEFSNFTSTTYQFAFPFNGTTNNGTAVAYAYANIMPAKPTASLLSFGTFVYVNNSASTYIAYLFATCAGVSKVGIYTGTGALQTIDCGFTAGSRFVIIKRASTGGSMYVYDSTRGLSSSDDPFILLDTNAAEVTGTNYVDTTTTGFQVTAAASTTVNTSGVTYIFLAIA